MCGQRSPLLGIWMSEQQVHSVAYVSETVPFGPLTQRKGPAD